MKVTASLFTILLVIIMVSLIQSEPGFNGTDLVVVEAVVILYNLVTLLQQF